MFLDANADLDEIGLLDAVERLPNVAIFHYNLPATSATRRPCGGQGAAATRV